MNSRPYFDDGGIHLYFSQEGRAGRCRASMVPDLEDDSLNTRSAIGNTAFGIGIDVTHEQE